nr:hypothetical protein POPTR_003G189000 [Ipomoea batatas]GMD35764.1 hypothetical protein POPTR_003G189000 [Ipomoea batatas]GMD38978.1 hypothetical protein POPTR_003G189000 [Ipomoea batatas]
MTTVFPGGYEAFRVEIMGSYKYECNLIHEFPKPISFIIGAFIESSTSKIELTFHFQFMAISTNQQWRGQGAGPRPHAPPLAKSLWAPGPCFASCQSRRDVPKPSLSQPRWPQTPMLNQGGLPTPSQFYLGLVGDPTGTGPRSLMTMAVGEHVFPRSEKLCVGGTNIIRALSQVVPDLGKLAKRTSLGCGLKCCWSARRLWMTHGGYQNPFSK